MNVVFNCLLLDLRSKKNLNGACLSFWKRGIKCDLCSKTFISFYFDADWLVLTLPCSIDDFFFHQKNLIRKDRFRFAIAFYELLIEYRFKNLFQIIFFRQLANATTFLSKCALCSNHQTWCEFVHQLWIESCIIFKGRYVHNHVAYTPNCNIFRSN